MSVDNLLSVLPGLWTRDTSDTPNLWTPEQPWVGQAAVSALVVHHECGGTIVTDGSACWNRLPGGAIVSAVPDPSPTGNGQTIEPAGLLNPNRSTRFRMLLDAFHETTVDPLALQVELTRWVFDQLIPAATTQALRHGSDMATDRLPRRLVPAARLAWPDAPLLVEPEPG